MPTAVPTCRLRRTPPVRALAGTLVLGLGLAGCGSSSTPSSDQPTKRIAITITGNSVSPNGTRVDVSRGQPVELDVTSDAPGVLHVHTDPDHEWDYRAGTQSFRFDAPDSAGIVDVETHTLDKTIVQLYVR